MKNTNNKYETITLEKHQEVGENIKELRDFLLHQIAVGYPTDKRKICKVIKNLDNMKSGLDDLLFKHHPGSATTSTYYGMSEKKIQEQMINLSKA